MKTEIDNMRAKDVEDIKLPTLYLKSRDFTEIIIIILLSPLLLLFIAIVSVFILISSGRPVFFVQLRPGLNDTKFKMLKFRTFKKNYGNSQAHNIEDKLIPAGRFLRKHRIDELPQLWNILTGKMSLIGPRPEAYNYYEECKAKLPLYKYRFRVKPGLTGWAQVNYKYTDDIDGAKEKLKYDIFYLENISLLTDLKIIYKTFSVVIKPVQ